MKGKVPVSIAVFADKSLLPSTIFRLMIMELLQTRNADPNTWVTATYDGGSLLAYYSVDDTLGCWDITSNTLLPLLKLDLPTSVSEISGLTFSPDNRTLAFATWDDVVCMYHVAP